MKKLYKAITFIMIPLIVMLSFSVAVSAMNFDWDMQIGDTLTLGMSDTPYVSSDDSVVVIQYEGNCMYTAVAVGKGTAIVTGGTWMGANAGDYTINVYRSQFDHMMGYIGGFSVVIIILILLVFAEIIYIFMSAPKCGMSRLWALIPIFSNVLGLVVFIIVRSNRKTISAKNTITCPNCNRVHSANTVFCPMCGTKLK